MLEFFKEEIKPRSFSDPSLAVGSQDGCFVLDLGAGVALLTRHTFKKQDYGGELIGSDRDSRRLAARGAALQRR